MFKRILALTFSVLCATLISQPAQAIISFSPVAAVNSTTIKVDNTTYNPDGVGMGAGALLGIDFLPIVGLEVGALYAHRKVKATTLVGPFLVGTKVDLTEIEIPVLLRFSLIPKVFSIGIGGYYSRFKSATSIAYDVNNPSNASAFTSNVTGNDMGFLASAAIHIPLGLVTSILADGRYHYGFKAVKVSEIQGLFGLSFGI